MRFTCIGVVCLALVNPCASFGLGCAPMQPKFNLDNNKVHRQCSSASFASLAMSGQEAGISGMKVTRRNLLIAAGFQIVTSASLPALAGGLDESWEEELGGSDGQGVQVKFSFPKSWKLERKDGTLLVNEEAAKACDADPDKCLLGEVFSRSPGGDSAILNIGTSGQSDVSKIPFAFIKKQIFNRAGKLGAYGAPEDVKALSDKSENGLRLVDVKFTAFSPGGASISRRGIVAVRQAGPEAYMLAITTSTSRWKNNEGIIRDIASSLQATSTGKPAPVVKKVEGVKKSMFAAQNQEREALEKERLKEGIQ